MNALGRGLASLIPNRSRDEDESEDYIETMETTEDAPEETNKTTVSVMEDFDELDGVDSEPAPEKPLTTPITIDPDDSDEINEASEADIPSAEEKPAGRSVTVESDEDEDSVEAVEDEVVEAEAADDSEEPDDSVAPEAAVEEFDFDDEEDEDDDISGGAAAPEMKVTEMEIEKMVKARRAKAAAAEGEALGQSQDEKMEREEPEQEEVEEEAAKKQEKEAAAVHSRIDDSNKHEAVEAEQKQPEAKAEEQEEQPEVKVTPVEGIEEAAMRVSEGWDKHEDRVQHIVIGDVSINPLQPRRSFDAEEMAELKASIEKHGILQPLVVRRMPEGSDTKYELIAGERRLRATKDLGWDKVPCVVRRDVASDDSRLVYALIENIQRENLNPIEEARAYQQLNLEYGLTHEEIGERVGKTRVRITNIMRVLKLPAEIQRGLSEGKITSGHAKAILMIPDPEKQLKFYRHMLEEGLTVRKAELRARRIQRSMNIVDSQRKRVGSRHPLAQRYSPILEDRYGFDARIKYNEQSNRFDITFRAFNNEELEELVGRLVGTRDLPNLEQETEAPAEEEGGE